MMITMGESVLEHLVNEASKAEGVMHGIEPQSDSEQSSDLSDTGEKEEEDAQSVSGEGYSPSELKRLRFYSTRRGIIGRTYSNFSNHPFFADGKLYRTNEHYFQSKKFEGSDDTWAETIRKCRSASGAKKKGSSRLHRIRTDWEVVKEDVMYRGLELKAVYNEDFVNDLLASSNQELIEASPSDYYWGEGYHKTGKNRLGYLLVILREEIRAKKEWKELIKKRDTPKGSEGGQGSSREEIRIKKDLLKAARPSQKHSLRSSKEPDDDKEDGQSPSKERPSSPKRKERTEQEEDGHSPSEGQSPSDPLELEGKQCGEKKARNTRSKGI